MNKTFSINDLVTVISRQGPRRQLRVTAIKEYKRGPKVTTSDGKEWDVKGCCPWGQRSSRGYHHSDYITHATEEHTAKILRSRALNRLAWLAANADELTDEELSAIVTASVGARHRLKA